MFFEFLLMHKFKSAENIFLSIGFAYVVFLPNFIHETRL